MLRAERCLPLLLLACLGCGRAAADADSVGGGRRANDEVRIPREILSRMERALDAPAERALALASEDALLAHELARTDPAHARALATLARARVLLGTLRGEVAREQPVQDAEIEALAAERWWEFERPRMVRVIHAVVRSSEESAAAQALAAKIREAVLASASPAEFRKAAEAVSAQELSVRVESLPPIAPDGRSVEVEDPPPLGRPVANMVREFAEAATRLETKGEVSPVVRSQFGYHVIQLVDIVPPSTLAPEQRRARLEAEVLTERARRKTQELLDRLRRELAPEQSRAAVAAMEKVSAPP